MYGLFENKDSYKTASILIFALFYLLLYNQFLCFDVVRCNLYDDLSLRPIT